VAGKQCPSVLPEKKKIILEDLMVRNKSCAGLDDQITRRKRGVSSRKGKKGKDFIDQAEDSKLSSFGKKVRAQIKVTSPDESSEEGEEGSR